MRFVLICVLVLMATTVMADQMYWEDTASASGDDLGSTDYDTIKVSVTAHPMWLGYYYDVGLPTDFCQTYLGLRFDDCPIKRGARIDSAFIGGVFYSNIGDSANYVIYSRHYGDVGIFQPGDTLLPTSRWAEEGWVIQGADTLTQGDRVWGPDIGYLGYADPARSDIMQVWIERADYTSGNAYGISIFDETDGIPPEEPFETADQVIAWYSADAGQSTANDWIIKVWYTNAITSLSLHYQWVDYPTAVDSIDVLVDVGDINMGYNDALNYDSIFFSVSVSAYPDSTTYVSAPWPTTGTTVTKTIGGFSLTEGESAYVSAWAWMDTCRAYVMGADGWGETWSERSTATTTLTAQLQISGATIQGVTIE